MDKQDSFVFDSMLFDILFHTKESFCCICRIKRYSVLNQHFPDNIFDFGILFSVSIADIIINKYGCFIYPRIITHVFSDTFKDDISTSRILSRDTNADNILRAVILQFSANQTGLCRSCSGSKENVIEVALTSNFFIALNICFRTDAPVSSTWNKKRGPSLRPQSRQFFFNCIMYLIYGNSNDLRTKKLHHVAVEGLIRYLFRTDYYAS